MDENRVIEAANDLRLDRLLPTHYNMWKGLESTVESLSSHSTSFEYPYTIEPVDIGDRVSTTRPGIIPLEVLNGT
jgi:L-ascorbate 6-phosphate lactonase